MKISKFLFLTLLFCSLSSVVFSQAQRVRSLNIAIRFDDHPEEISWELIQTSSGNVVGTGGSFDKRFANKLVIQEFSSAFGFLDYSIRLKDAAGNGLGENGGWAIFTRGAVQNIEERRVDQERFSANRVINGENDFGSETTRSFNYNDRDNSTGQLGTVTGNDIFVVQTVSGRLYQPNNNNRFVFVRYSQIAGGVTTPTPNKSCKGNEVDLAIKFDNYPQETSWQIVNEASDVVASGGSYRNQKNGDLLNIKECLPSGKYTFKILDAYGDGICCTYGNGFYSLKSGDTVLAQGGSFGKVEETNFTLGNRGGKALATVVEGEFSAYPNPFNETFTLDLRDFQNEKVNIVIADINGKVVFNEVSEDRNTLEIGSTLTQNGFYFIQVVGASKTASHKILKQ